MKTAVIIGAGIIGLHFAHALRTKGYEVYLLERDDTLGEQCSGRNSGVIHAGIFYPSGSLKEQSCLEGNRLSYEWLERLKVPHRRCGKWLVPESGQESQLGAFYERLRGLPLQGIRFCRGAEVAAEEPRLRPTEAISVASTGILDAGTYLKNLSIFLEEEGVQVLTHCEVRGVDGHTLRTSRGEMPFDLAVNAAGLFSDEVAAWAGVSGYEIRPCRGDYFIAPHCPLSRPVYHLPYAGEPGLGVHLTPTLDDQLLIGPNAFFIDAKLDYKHRSSEADFLKALAYYLPGQDFPSLHPDYSGNRPKLYHSGKAVDDFTIVQEGGWIHLLGIESPGLTAAPALAQYVMNLL